MPHDQPHKVVLVAESVEGYVTTVVGVTLALGDSARPEQGEVGHQVNDTLKDKGFFVGVGLQLWLGSIKLGTATLFWLNRWPVVPFTVTAVTFALSSGSA